ncbi:hypothetical protein M1N05_01230 [Dehalococcoidales bacterium]|nr:hypothetical protein [Dehalococcoidales bacterium]
MGSSQYRANKRGTVERNLENLGKIKITAEPGPTTTSYLIELEKPVLRESLLLKKVQELDLNLRGAKTEEELDSILREVRPTLPLKQRVEAIRLPSLLSATVYSSQKLRCHVNSTDPELCTELITFFCG